MFNLFYPVRACLCQMSTVSGTIWMDKHIMVNRRCFDFHDTRSLQLLIELPCFLFLFAAELDIDLACRTGWFLFSRSLSNTPLKFFLSTHTVAPGAKQFVVIANHGDRTVPLTKSLTRCSLLNISRRCEGSCGHSCVC